MHDDTLDDVPQLSAAPPRSAVPADQHPIDPFADNVAAVPTPSVAAHEALRLLKHGVRIVPIHYGTGEPATEWTQRRLQQDDIAAALADPLVGLGAAMGADSRWLVAVVLQSEYALRAAPHLLPMTRTFGRASRRQCTHLYFADGAASVALDDDRGNPVVEMRSTGSHLLMPSARHTSGEALEWDAGDARTIIIDARELEQRVHWLAAVGLLARNYPERGRRHLVPLVLGAALLDCGWARTDATDVVRAVADAACDEDAQMRAQGVDLVARHDLGDGDSVWERLEPLFGSGAVGLARKWLTPPTGGLRLLTMPWRSKRVTGQPLVTTVVVEFQLGETIANLREAFAMRNVPPEYYRYGGRLTSVRISAPREGSDSPTVEMREESYRTLLGMLSSMFDWRLAVPRKNGTDDAHPPGDAIHDLVANPDPELPELRRVASTPLFGRGGQLIITPGYHAEEKLLMVPPPNLKLPPIDATPAGVRRAVDFLRLELLADFALADDASTAHVFAAMLQPLVRAMYGGPSPLFVITSRCPGSGKGLLAEMIARISTGRPPTPISLSFGNAHDEAESRRTLTSVLRTAPEVLLLDNVKMEQPIDSAALAAILTSTWWRDRIVGSSLAPELPNFGLWIATGNEVSFSVEMSRRAVISTLAPNTDRPAERNSFRHANLRKWVREHRADLLAALVTLVTAWQLEFRPPEPGSLGSYEEWAGLLADILEVAGIEGFLENRDAVRIAEPEAEEIRLVVAAWWKQHGNTTVRATELLQTLKASRIRIRTAGQSDAAQLSALGLLLQRNAGREVDGLRIIRTKDSHTKSHLYALVDERPPQPPMEDW